MIQDSHAHRPRVLLVGYYGRRNFGDDVLLKVAYAMVKEMLPSAQIHVIVPQDAQAYVHRMLGEVTFLPPDDRGHFDYIIHGGGGTFFDFQNYGFVSRMTEHLLFAFGMGTYLKTERILRRILGRPSISATQRLGLGIGVGGFSVGSMRLRFALPQLADFCALWVRDAKSSVYLKPFESVMHAQPIVGSDLAFLTNYWVPEQVTHPTRSLGKKPRLGVALRDSVASIKSTDRQVLEKTLASLAHDYDITGFVFDETADPGMIELLKPYPTHIWRPENMRIEEFVQALAGQDVLLASRAHAAICGACVGVASVILDYEPKLTQVHHMLPNASVMAGIHDTKSWPIAIQEALAIRKEAIAADVEKNREASASAWEQIQRKKVLMVITQLGYGGAETSFVRLANHLVQTMEVTVALFTRDYGIDGYAQGHETLHANLVLLDGPTPCRRIQRWWRRVHTLRRLKKQHDVTISFLSGPNILNVLAGCNARSIISLRGSRIYDPASPGMRRLFRYVFDPIIFHLATRIVPVSRGITTEIRQTAGEKAVAKVRVISPFIDLAVLNMRRTEMPASAYASLRDQPVIVAVGRLSVVKGFHHLIRVFAEIAKQKTDAKLLLIGDGPMLPALRAQCTALGLTMDNVTPGTASVLFAGYQKNPLPLMAFGRVYAMSSATEGFPNVMLEAMAMGIPVVAANVPWGVRDILGDSPANQEPYPTIEPLVTDYGVLMPRIDNTQYQSHWVQTLMEYVNGSRMLSPNAQTRVQAYDSANIMPQWEALINELCRISHERT